jgi:hypothetical protein
MRSIEPDAVLAAAMELLALAGSEHKRVASSEHKRVAGRRA